MFKTLAGGGQTTAHGVRMLRQVVKIAILVSLIVVFVYMVFKLWKVPEVYWKAFPNYVKAAVKLDAPACEYYDEYIVELFEYAGRQLKPAARYGLWAFLGVVTLFQIKGLLDKRSKKFKPKSSVRRVRIKNKLHRGFHLGKASLPKNSENKHILVSGGTGSGKTNAFHHLMPQIRERGHKAVILDSTGVFVERYYKEETDIILNPIHEKTKHWTPWLDAKDSIDYEALAKSFIPIKDSDHDSYWKESAATVFSSLLEVYAETEDEKPLETLIEILLAKPLKDLIEAVEGTAAVAHISKEGDKSTASIRSTAAAYLTCLKYLKTPNEEEVFSINSWIADESQKGFLFLSCDPKTRDALKPLLSAWYSTAIRALMSLAPDESRRVWFINDELPSMDKINGLKTCLTEGRKYGACALLAVQSPSQLVDIYGKELAKTITANCHTKIIFRETEPENAEQLSRLFGRQEILETQEGLSYGANQIRDGVTQSKILRNRPVISTSDIQNLKINHCYLRNAEGKIERLKLNIYRKIT